jgi:3-methyl-2-oxobutanoate hydroxymethyltransferase
VPQKCQNIEAVASTTIPFCNQFIVLKLNMKFLSRRNDSTTLHSERARGTSHMIRGVSSLVRDSSRRSHGRGGRMLAASGQRELAYLGETATAQPRPRPKKMTTSRLQLKCESGEKIAMMTCYDAAWAKLLDGRVDALLVGDSVANVCLGLPDTRSVGMDAMVHHTRAVRHGTHSSLLVSDMPFGSNMVLDDALRNATRLLAEGGADAVKIEGGRAQKNTIERLVQQGVPVMGHVGLLPQTAGAMTGFRMQCTREREIRGVLDDCRALGDAGVFSIVLELIPNEVAEAITRMMREEYRVPTIGIGAGTDTAGQVLVLHDALGIRAPDARKLRFVEEFAGLGAAAISGVEAYAQAVRGGAFPGEQHGHRLDADGQRVLKQLERELNIPPLVKAASLTSSPPEEITVVGSGAIGSLLAAKLSLSGEKVSLRRMRPSPARDIRVLGTRRTSVHVDTVVGDVPATSNIAFIATKNDRAALDEVVGMLRTAVAESPDLVVVMMQNGAGAPEHVQNALPHARVIQCVTTHGSTVSPEGVHHAGGAWTFVGNVGPPLTLDSAPLHRSSTVVPHGVVEHVATVLTQAGFEAKALSPEEMFVERLRKIVVSASLVSTAAIAGETNGGVIKSPLLTRQMERLAREAGTVAFRLAQQNASTQDRLGASQAEAESVAITAARAVAEATATNTCSMLADLRAGRRTEADATLGWVIRQGAALGVDTPVSRLALEAIEAREALNVL